jgi:hypothetical protein
VLFVLIAGAGFGVFAQPVFENQTPKGFSLSDSTASPTFITDKDITILVDLNEGANAANPVIGNFQKVEKAKPYYSTAFTAGYMSQAIAVDANGVIHRAWIQARGNAVLGMNTIADRSTTPAYGVVYAKSYNGGKTFSDTVSVSGSLRFDMITPNMTMSGGFSTLDIAVDSKGNPRVVYAMDNSPDGKTGQVQTGHVAVEQMEFYSTGSLTRQFNNIYFNYSNDGGSTWLPANNAVVVNDTSTVGVGGLWTGRKTCFPRMDITSTDDIFIVYERDNAGTEDIMLAKMDADSLKSGSARPVQVGSMGTVGSSGGVRLDIDGTMAVAPDIAIGDDDVIHIVWYEPVGDQIEYKSLRASEWTDITDFGWDNTVAGATVGSFDDDATNIGLDQVTFAGDFTREAYGSIHLFPTVVVDRERSPDRVYVLWKHTDATTVAAATGGGEDENIAYAVYNYDGLAGGSASFGSTQFAFPTGSGSNMYNAGGSGLFQNNTHYQIEGFWGYVDRVAAVVDDRIPNSRGDVHIVFSGGPSQKGPNLTASLNESPAVGYHGWATNLYYARFNGTEWELPQVVATAKNTSTALQAAHDDGVVAASRQLFSPDIAMRSGDANVYLTFVGGSPAIQATEMGARNSRGIDLDAVNNPGRGFASLHTGNVSPLPYFKIIGRVITFSDISQPSGGFQYLMTYNPVIPQEPGVATTKNLITISVADNANGSGVGGATPGSSQAPGGFLTGQWRQVSLTTLGVTSLNPGESGAVFKGAVSQSEATNDVGVFEGKVDDDGSKGFAEWGDDADKVGLLVKLNVLGSDSATNLFVISKSSAARGQSATVNLTGEVTSDSSTQSIVIDTTIAAGTALGPSGTTFVKGITSVVDVTGRMAPMGSYFWMGANINIVATNAAPVVQVTDPDAATLGSGTFANETTAIRYVLYDSDNDILTSTTGLQMEMYAYPDKGLSNVQDIRTFALLVVDEQDNTTVNANGTNDFTEGSSSSNVQTYTWDDPGTTLRGLGFASITKTLDGNYYIYLVADDGVNPPVLAISGGPLRIRHIPLVKSITPVGSDTVDTGEYSDLNKSNPYKVKFTLLDFNDNALVRLFFTTNSGLTSDSVRVSGTYPSQTLELGGATPMQLSDSLRTGEDVDFSFDVTAQGSARDSVIAQGAYSVYAVVADGDTAVVGKSSTTLAVRHSPAFEFTAPLLNTVDKINTTQQFAYSVQWQRGRSDQDLDGNAFISLYYTGIDPQRKNFTGRDSTALIDSAAVLIQGSLRENPEGGSDQFIWNYRNPPSALPKVFRPKASTVDDDELPNIYQAGATTDTAWIYAVLHDTLGNTRVQGGGAVLLLGSQESPASQAPRVTMTTPPSGGQTITNGDVVRLEWDAFLIDDGTGTDDAYLRLYAAPVGLYTTITQLEGNNLSGGNRDVILINSLTGKDDVASNISNLRESSPKFLMWDTKTHSFGISGTPIEYEIFVAGSMNPRFGDNVIVNGVLDSVAMGYGSRAQKAVLSKAPGRLRVVGTDPLFGIELSPGAATASSGDTLSVDVLINSQGTSVNVFDLHLDVPRNYFEVVDMDTATAGVQPFADSTGAFQAPSTIAQNDTTAGTAQFVELNFVEAVILGEAIGRAVAPYDSSQVAARLKLVVKRFQAGAPLDTVLVWSSEAGRKTALYQDRNEAAAAARDGHVVLTPRARIIATAPLESRTNYSDTLDAHLRLIGNVQDITDASYLQANDKVTASADSVQVVSDAFGTFTLYEIPPGIYELTVKAPGFVSGRTDTLNLFNGLTETPNPTYGSDVLGNLSPATPLNALRGGDATGDNQIDIADANLMFSVWNKTVADPTYVRAADINRDGVINAIDFTLVTTNFGNAGYGAPPVFKRSTAAGDNAAALVSVEGVEDVESWWPGRVFEVRARVEGMDDVAAYGLRLSYDPERVKPLAGDQAVAEGDVFRKNPQGSLFYQRNLPGVVEVTAGRIGREWSASGDADLVKVRFVALTNDPGKVDVVGGELVNSDYRGIPMQVRAASALPQVAALLPNYPNPFNPSTEIRFDIPTARDVKLRVYNQLGQAVRTLVEGRMKAGSYSLKWDGTNAAGLAVASGVYFYSLDAGDFSQVRKMTLVK